jgi:hypothetical protein
MLHEVSMAMFMLVAAFWCVNRECLVAHVSGKATTTFRVVCLVGED